MGRTPKPVTSGRIDAATVYRIPAFCEELGISRQRLVDMRNRGLPIREDGKYRVILGRDYLEWAATLPVKSADK